MLVRKKTQNEKIWSQFTNNLFFCDLDNNSGNLAFKHGIYDLENNVFREVILSTDFISDTIPSNYTTSNEEKNLFKNQIKWNNE